MEPLNSDYDYVVRQPRDVNPRARFNWLLIVPVLGALWLLYLLGAAVFQWSADGIVGPAMSLVLVLFLGSVALLFWVMAPKANR